MLLAEHWLFILITDHRFYERTLINRCLFNIPSRYAYEQLVHIPLGVLYVFSENLDDNNFFIYKVNTP